MATSMFFFIAGLTFASWASRIPDIKLQLRMSDGALGAVLFALPVGQMISIPISAALVARFGSKSVVTIGALMYPLTLVMLALSNSVFLLALSLFVFGLWANLLNIAMNTQAVSVESRYGRSIMASFHGVWSIAGFSGALLATMLVSMGFSILSHFSIVIVLTGITVFVANRYTVSTITKAADNQKRKLFSMPEKRIMILGLIAFSCMVCEGAMADWSGVYYQKVIEAPAALTTIGYVAFMGTMAIGRFVGDWLVTRFGVVRILQLSGTKVASGLLLAVAVPQIVTATIGFLLVGLGVSSVVPVVFGLAGRSANKSASGAIAAVSTIGFLGFLAGPPIIGFIAEATNLRLSFVVIALLGFGTTLLAGKTKNM